MIAGSAGGALLSQVIDMGTRAAFGLPQKTWGQTAQDTALSMTLNPLTEGLLGAANKWLTGAKDHILYGHFTPLTPGESAQVGVLGQGSRLAGTYGTANEAFPSPSMLTEGSQGQRLPSMRTWANDVSNVSLGGSQIARTRARDFQIAKDAWATDVMRQLGEDGALADASQASRVIHDMTANRFQVSREIRRAAYDSAGSLPGAIAPIDTGTLYQTFDALSSRLDVGSVIASTENRFSFTNTDLLTHLTNAQGQQVSNYRNLAELRSTLLYIQRTKAAQAANAANGAGLLAESRTAGYLASQVGQTLETAAASGQIPRRTLLAFQYADKLASEEAHTFTNPLILKIVDHFKDQPETFARELLKPDNADTLVAIHKAITETPDVITHLSPQTPETFYRGELQRPSLYKRVANAQGKDTWEQTIQPNLQAQLFRDSLEQQSGGAFEQALTYGQSPVYGQAKQAFQGGAADALRPSPDDFVRLDPSKMLTNLEALTPNTRTALFGSEQAYNRALTAAKAMQNYQLKEKAGLGSFLVLSKQSMALTQMMGVAGGAFAGYQQGNPLLAIGVPTGILLAPIVWASMVNNPQTFKQFMLAMKQTPQNAMKSRVIVQMMQNSVREFAQESEKAYPVLPGESR
jgi:hypothetical protein